MHEHCYAIQKHKAKEKISIKINDKLKNKECNMQLES